MRITLLPFIRKIWEFFFKPKQPLMRDQSDAFLVLKTEQQRILDFSKLVCYSVPNLKKSIKGFKEKVTNYETLVQADYFVEPVDVNRLAELAKHYKDNLSKYILISSFSFLESYFRDVIKELEDFHGGLPNLIKHVQQRQAVLKGAYTADMNEKKQLLQTTYKKRRWQKYQNLLTSLESEVAYRHPSELFSAYGVKSFFELVSSNGFKSVMIPDLVEIGLGLDLSDKINKHPDLADKTLRETFDTMRDLRNSVGHGKANNVNFDKVMDLIRFVRYFSVLVDSHLVRNFFVIQEY
jgi:hypothetical protein